MIVAMIFAHLWGLLQLILLGSFARTVRVRTTLAAMAAGVYACATVAVLFELSWTRLAARFTATPIPLALLFLAPVIRRQWSTTDCVLVGSARIRLRSGGRAVPLQRTVCQLRLDRGRLAPTKWVRRHRRRTRSIDNGNFLAPCRSADGQHVYLVLKSSAVFGSSSLLVRSRWIRGWSAFAA